jgi:hypothetical protein
MLSIFLSFYVRNMATDPQMFCPVVERMKKNQVIPFLPVNSATKLVAPNIEMGSDSGGYAWFYKQFSKDALIINVHVIHKYCFRTFSALLKWESDRDQKLRQREQEHM